MEKNNQVDSIYCTGCFSRRQFLSSSAMAAAALALAACAGADITSPTSINADVKISEHQSLSTVGGVAMLSLNGAPIAVVRTGETSFVALSRICPHQGSTINTSGNGFLCPNHGAQFNKTGQWVGGQPTSNMRSYPVTYNADTDTITIG